MTRTLLLTSLFCSFLCAPACSPPEAANAPNEPAAQAKQAPQRVFEPIDSDKAVLWDRQTTQTADLLKQLVKEFNQNRTGVPLEAQYIGGYSEIYRKVTASIEAGKLPAMAGSYESMTSEYIQSGAVAKLDAFVEDPRSGYTSDELADFFPVVMEINRYPEFDNGMYSFPFTKSVLVMYFNENVLRQAGIDAPPRTWDDFLVQCRQVKESTGNFAYALHVDPSTIDGMIFSMGGELVDGKKTLFDRPPSIRTFELVETLAKEKLCYQITPQTFDDEAALAQGKVAFMIRTSSSRVSVLRLMGEKTEGWGIAPIPQANPDDPRTVLFGANVCVFNVPQEQQKTAWDFIKFFTSPDVNVRWALGTGYVPIRKSAAQDPRIQAFWSEWKYNRVPYDCLSFARSEPKLAGWQKVRTLIEDAETAVLTGLKTGRQAALDLKREADAALK